MKNSKREISLNEKDSIFDILETEKSLARSYLEASFCAEKKEERERFFSFAKESLDTSVSLFGLFQEREENF